MKVIPLTENETREMRKRHAEMVEAGRAVGKATEQRQKAEAVFYSQLKNLGEIYGEADATLKLSDDYRYLVVVERLLVMDSEPDLDPDIERCVDCRRALDACVCAADPR